MKDWLDAVVSTEWVGQQYKNHNAYTNQDFLLTVLLTGFRREEAETIEWSHVDLKYGSITSSSVPLSSAIAAAKASTPVGRPSKRSSNILR